jgi:hypothetical protein
MIRFQISTLIFTGIFLSSSFSFSQDMGLPYVEGNTETQWFRPLGMTDKAIQNQLMEIGFLSNEEISSQIDFFKKTGKGGLNPYDPDQITLTAEFSSSSGEIYSRVGFYYEDQRQDYRNDRYLPLNTQYNWRIRFSPPEAGSWMMTATIAYSGKSLQYRMGFNAVESPRKGRLQAVSTGTNKDRYLHHATTKEAFFAFGENISSGGFFTLKPSQLEAQLTAISQLKTAGGNFSRFEMSAQGPLPDWPNINEYSEKQDEMYAFDKLMQTIEEKEIYSIVFRHHVEVNGDHWDLPNWENNPYRKGFNLQKPSEYFTNPDCIKLQNNSIRYQIARWGSCQYFSFFGYSEIDNWLKPMINDEGLSEKQALTIFKKWFVDQKNYILQELNADIKFINSYASTPKVEKKNKSAGLLQESEVIAFHKYGAHKGLNFDNRAATIEELFKEYGKPVLLEEMGLDPNKLPISCCTGVEFHNSIMSTAFMGGMGTGMEWWWNRGIHDFGYIKDLECAQRVFKGIDLSKGNFGPQLYSDAREKKRTIESYALVGDSGRTVIGWVKNATIYWRNLSTEYKCIEDLVRDGKLSEDCMSKDGQVNFRKDSTPEYAYDVYRDAYTGMEPITIGSKADITQNPEVKIKDLRSGRGKNTNWYKVEFYNNEFAEPFRPLYTYTQYVSSNWFGNLKFHVPFMSVDYRDYSYKITWLGEGKTNPIPARGRR